MKSNLSTGWRILEGTGALCGVLAVFMISFAMGTIFIHEPHTGLIIIGGAVLVAMLAWLIGPWAEKQCND